MNTQDLRHEIDNCLLALGALVDELKDESISSNDRKERLKEIDEYSKKLLKCWDEYKKTAR